VSHNSFLIVGCGLLLIAAFIGSVGRRSRAGR
jgi:hypothetical protein